MTHEGNVNNTDLYFRTDNIRYPIFNCYPWSVCLVNVRSTYSLYVHLFCKILPTIIYDLVTIALTTYSNRLPSVKFYTNPSFFLFSKCLKTINIYIPHKSPVLIVWKTPHLLIYIITSESLLGLIFLRKSSVISQSHLPLRYTSKSF